MATLELTQRADCSDWSRSIKAESIRRLITNCMRFYNKDEIDRATSAIIPFLELWY